MSIDPELQAFEDARSNRDTRMDPAIHKFLPPDHKGAVRLDMENSTYRDRLRPIGTPAAPGARHEGVAADLARAYVDAHPEMEVLYGGLTVPQLVEAVDNARLAGDEEKRIRIDAWLMANFAPFRIEGVHTGTAADR